MEPRGLFQGFLEGGGGTAQQASCARTLEVNVRGAFRTADGAASGVLTGYAMQVIAGTAAKGRAKALRSRARSWRCRRR
jgi:hypothetical protein